MLLLLLASVRNNQPPGKTDASPAFISTTSLAPNSTDLNPLDYKRC